MKRILVTGAAGYVGSILVRSLLARDFHVRGVDCLLFGDSGVVDLASESRFELLPIDIRDTGAIDEALTGIEGVVHLAALVGDPACGREPELTEETNWAASKALFDRCVDSDQVERFIFASTCSNYGKMPDQNYVDESSDLRTA